MARPGDRVKVRGTKAVITVDEYTHAYVVRGYGIKWGITIQQARLALFEWLGRKKWTRIEQMPYRHMWTGDIGDDEPTGSVVFYFNIGPRCGRKGCRLCSRKDRYKP